MSKEAKKYDWRKYDESRPRLVIRLDREEKDALDVAARTLNLNISRKVSDFLRPVVLIGTPAGQRAYQIITAGVQASIAWNSRHAHGFGDTEPVRDKDGYPARYTWRRSDILVSPRTTKDGQTVNYHTVVQREGESRSDAIMRYTELLICAWADTPEDLRDGLLSEIRNEGKHRFVVMFGGKP
jgi:hypothetical protein